MAAPEAEVGEAGPARPPAHWLSLFVPVDPAEIRNAIMSLGLHVQGTGLGWPPSEVLAQPWSDIQWYCDQVEAIWRKLAGKRDMA